jgi:protein-tyrosine phosphatase
MLPAPRSDTDTDTDTDTAYRIAVVCLGNICRSPVADVVLNARIEDAGLSGRVTVHSSGTGDWHLGGPMDRRAAATLTAEGYDPTNHRSRQFTDAHAGDYDLVLAMDRQNLADLRALGVDPDRLRLFRDFDPMPGDGEVPDPFYGGDDGFAKVLAMIERTAIALVEQLRATIGAGSR